MTPLVAAILMAGSLAGTGPGTAQDTAPAAKCTLTIRTGADTASVFIDSVRAGRTPLTLDSLRGGAHILRLVQEDTSAWLTGSITDTVYLSPGESRTLRYAFERRVMVVTDPSGALVYIGDSAAGTTPLVLSSRSSPLPGDVNVVRNGYERTMVPLPSSGSGIAKAVMHKMWQSEGPDDPFMTESGSSERTGLRLYVAGGVAVAAGAAAAYFKIRADGSNASFQNTGIPTYQDQTRRLDISAAISLAVSQIAFGFFTYYLLSD
ncbi:MAG TPA: PEGA domain-containing protein [Bacteroidota bacterium]|nr:PEGA domain-containing protein [Bacteroidota bacterium]